MTAVDTGGPRPKKQRKPGPLSKAAHDEVARICKRYYPQVATGPFKGAFAVQNSKIHPDISKYYWAAGVQRCHDHAETIAKEYKCKVKDVQQAMRK